MNTDILYKEEDLLKSINGNFIVEAYRCKRIQNTVIGLCTNSYPMFCRRQDNVHDSDYSWMEVLTPSSSILKHDNEEKEYNALCPKIAWGIAAYLLFHSYTDTKERVLFKMNQEVVQPSDLFQHYQEQNKIHYTILNKEDFDYYKSIGDTTSFDKEFFDYHIAQEESLINRQNVSIPDCIKEKAKEYIEWCIYKKEDLSKPKGSLSNDNAEQATKNIQSFRNIIQYKDPEIFLKRLHGLIDGKKGADVGCVLLKAKQENYITRNPTKDEYKSEFELIGSWSAITNYLSENNENALERANRIVIFK